jgi:hypothetical protein
MTQQDQQSAVFETWYEKDIGRLTGMDGEATIIAHYCRRAWQAAIEQVRQSRGEPVAWQPIETAPVGKNPDGTTWCLLVYGPDGDQSVGHGFRWRDKWVAAGTFYRLGQERKYELREVEVQPTHWMHTPELPDAAPQPAEPVKCDHPQCGQDVACGTCDPLPVEPVSGPIDCIPYARLMQLAKDAGLGPQDVSGLLQNRLSEFGRAVEREASARYSNAAQPSVPDDLWKQACDKAWSVARLYHTGAGMLYWIEQEHNRLLAAAPTPPADGQA